VRLLRPAATLEQTILASGSHDMTLDLLAQFLAGRGRRLASANVGSLGGLIALRRAEAHLAGCHLLDPASGSYNLAYLDRYLPGIPVVVIGLVGRQQGLIVAPGNPRGIGGLQDLARSDVRYANRQRGAGTRVLLDYHLEQLGLGPNEINGYDNEQITHLAVAAAIAGGRADCGLGIPAAAAALQLDFIPLFEEEYDLIIPEALRTIDLLRPLFDVLHEGEFRKAIERLPGYDTRRLGRQIFPPVT
jgi:putative molybdopterin biosynthesis protein